MNRADLMQHALRSGDWRSRHDIFRDCGQFFLTNNAASELRARGFTVERRQKNRQFQYRITAAGETNNADSSTPAAVSDPSGAVEDGRPTPSAYSVEPAGSRAGAPLGASQLALEVAA